MPPSLDDFSGCQFNHMCVYCHNVNGCFYRDVLNDIGVERQPELYKVSHHQDQVQVMSRFVLSRLSNPLQMVNPTIIYGFYFIAHPKGCANVLLYIIDYG